MSKKRNGIRGMTLQWRGREWQTSESTGSAGKELGQIPWLIFLQV